MRQAVEVARAECAASERCCVPRPAGCRLPRLVPLSQLCYTSAAPPPGEAALGVKAAERQLG